jgi:acyl carrier protein phosphodiesterase
MMDDIIDMKFKYTIQPERSGPVSLDIPYVRWPEFLAPWVISEDYLHYVEESVTHMLRNRQVTQWPPLCGKGFFDYEVNRFERLFYVIRNEINSLSNNPDKLKKLRISFVQYVDQYDTRRGTNFIKTFPEMEKFYHYCKKL